jgi:hypothetical protein
MINYQTLMYVLTVESIFSEYAQKYMPHTAIRAHFSTLLRQASDGTLYSVHILLGQRYETTDLAIQLTDNAQQRLAGTSSKYI